MSQVDLFCCIPRFYDLTDNLSKNMSLLGISNRVFKERVLSGTRDAGIPLVVVGDNFDYGIIEKMGRAERAILWISEMPPGGDEFCPHAERRFADLQREEKHFQLFITHSQYQRQFLQSVGYPNVELVGWPFSSYCRKLAAEKRTEVFFCGALSDRRISIINKLRDNEIQVEATDDCCGADLLIKLNSAKVVLNIHYEEVRNFEAMRILDAMGCGAFVVSEKIESDDLRDGMHFAMVNEDNIVSRIRYYLEHVDERECIASRGYNYVVENFNSSAVAKKFIKVLGKHGYLESEAPKSARTGRKSKPRKLRVSESSSRMPVPKVSVVIPCHNLGKYLDQTVDSVLRQTLQDFEIIVINDASTDVETVKLLDGYKRPNTRVIHVDKKNVAAARNCGIREAMGKYICCLDADDLLKPAFLKKTSSLLDKKPSVGFAGCWYEAFGEATWIFKPKDHGLSDFLVANQAPISSLFRRKAWEKVGGYDERLKGHEDWEFWINLLAHGYKCHIIEEILFKYRVRTDSKYRTSSLPENRSKIMKTIIEKHKDAFQKSAESVLLGKERIIGEMLGYQRQLEEDQEWHISGEHERYIEQISLAKKSLEAQHKELLGARGWFLKQIDSYERELARQHAELVRNQAEVVRLNHAVDINEHELRSIYFSKIWKLGCAFRDARRSLKGALLLPFRIVDLGCPNSLKRLIKRLLLVEPQETISKNFYKFPFRLLDRILPNRLKEAIPYQIRNLVRAVFGISDERLYKQKRWQGPLVSVIIPCYNYGRYLDESLQSVLRQTFPNYEVIIVDDGSTDRFTIGKLAKIEKRSYAKVKIVRQSNAGVSAARNNGIRSAKGKHICCLDADDCLEPTYLEKCLVVLESRNLDLCYTHVQLIGDESWVWKTVEFDVQRLLKDNCVSTAAVFKKSIWQKAGRYNTNMHHGWEDWDFWISVAEAGGCGAVVPEPLFIYRRHGETRDIKAAEKHSEILLKQMRENHRALYEGSARLPKTRRYKVMDPFINVLLEQTLPPIARDKDQILFLLPWMVVGGADNILLGLADALQKNGGAQVHIITTVEPLPSMGDSTPDFLKVTPYIYKLPGLLEEVLWYLYIEAYIKQRRINTIFICGCSFIYPLLSKIKRNAPHVKIIDQLFNDSPLGHVENNRRFADHIDLTIVPAEKIKTSILEKYGGKPDGIVAVYHGADSEYFDPDRVDVAESRRKFGIPDDKKVILYVGRLSVEKNPLLFLDLAAAFRNKSDYLFVIRGNGPLLEAVRSRADELSLNNIMFLGIMDAEDMPHLYRLADLFVITSQVEGIPLTIFESLAMNVPVVASDVGGISDVIQEGKHGYIYRPGAKEELIEKVHQSLAKSFGELRGGITKRYELKDVFLNYLAVFNR